MTRIAYLAPLFVLRPDCVCNMRANRIADARSVGHLHSMSSGRRCAHEAETRKTESPPRGLRAECCAHTDVMLVRVYFTFTLTLMVFVTAVYLAVAALVIFTWMVYVPFLHFFAKVILPFAEFTLTAFLILLGALAIL